MVVWNTIEYGRGMARWQGGKSRAPQDQKLASAVAKVKAHHLIRFLVHAQVSKDKWLSILGRGSCLCTSLCSAVVNGKSCDLAMSSDDTWHASASRDESWHAQHLHAPQRARGSIY
jgi:hypothetical protein